MNEFFRKFAQRSAIILGSAWAFFAAVTFTVVWFLSRPLFVSDDSWLIFMGGVTGVVTFLMVFIIQNSQNRDARAIHLKLDEIIRSLDRARPDLVDIEDLSDEELNRFETEFHLLRQRYMTQVTALKTARQAKRDGHQ